MYTPGEIGDLRVIVVGGSIGGLAAGVALTRAGVAVEIFERSSALMRERGAGLVLQPQVSDFFRRYDLSAPEGLAVLSHYRQFLSPQGEILSTQPFQQLMTSWDTIYTLLRQAFPQERYYYSRRLVTLEQKDDQVVAEFEAQGRVRGDLLIAADGANSTVRTLLLPEIKSEYAGYVAWRGVIEEADLDPQMAQLLVERFTFFTGSNTQMLSYLIPGWGGQLQPGHRRLNWVWYCTVPEADLKTLLTDRTGITREFSLPQGLIRPELVQEQLQIAEQVLPPVFVDLFKLTQEPFIQPIADLAVPRMVEGRVVLIGDAAFLARPHTAAGTAKAVSNASDLVDALRTYPGELTRGLSMWEPQQIRLGRYLKSMGISYRNLMLQP